MEMQTILQMADGFVSLAIAVWVIHLGVTRLDRLHEQQQKTSEILSSQYQSVIEKFMVIVENLCKD
jgi:hypothetical protein